MKIRVDEKVLNGNPYLSGYDMTVLDVVYECYYEGINSFLSNNPDIKISDLYNVLKYCGSRLCDLDNSHCGGCFLRLPQDNIKNMEDFINRFSEIRFVDSDESVQGNGQGIMIMPGNKNALPETWKGVKGWEMASLLLKDTMWSDPE